MLAAGESAVFGRLDDGAEIRECAIAAGGLSASILTYGAAVRRLRVGGRDVVLGLETLEDYVLHSPHMGAIAGRYANRIKGGRFELDGVPVQLTCNEGDNHLHGGARGFGKRAWQLEQHDKRSVLLKYVSRDGEEGYPGRVEALCRYTLTGSGALRIKLTATTDAPTLVNLAHHSYFNLGGGADVLDHTVEIAAERYLPIDAEAIPTGQIRKVDWTPYDFREGRRIRRKPSEKDVIFDHNFCLADAPRGDLGFAASVEAPDEDCRMEVWTTEPGLQFYDGAKLNVPVAGLDGRRYGPCAGFCMEPQRWPDSPNHADFPGAVLRPGESYSQVTEYRFA
ncbi:aldose epimerase family protein [Breoghania sp. L-A4]|uniref:aldose epimerase family protein n=1 Tax=Breoghania sp. L-A4 TaxID=2304600 RepID=UPI000E359B26|nr:aldose epimerase family protein [Breoghania sp. L-A4]AXS38900.1 galactose mutarotase [Breoghania sp. L-A4]